MKFLIVSLSLAVVASAQKGSGNPESYAKILNQDQDVSPDGKYSYRYDTENGISFAAQGSPVATGPNGEVIIEEQGGYQYTGPDGQLYAIKYVAGPNGFVAEGPHLPVSPPIPEAILRSIAFNEQNAPKEGPYKQPPQPVYQPSSTPSPFQYSPTPQYQPNYYQAGAQRPNFYNGRFQ